MVGNAFGAVYWNPSTASGRFLGSSFTASKAPVGVVTLGSKGGQVKNTGSKQTAQTGTI